MNMAEPLTVLKAELLQKIVPQVVAQLTAALEEGRPVHLVEHELWDLMLQVGRRSLGAFFQAHGSGDQGETLTLRDGQEVQRLPELHTRT